MRLLVFSSPLHFMTSLLVAKSSGTPCVGLYLEHKKNCVDIFDRISRRLNLKLEYVCDEGKLDDLGDISEVVISNRFDANQILIAQRYKSRCPLSFMEEGASIYLRESHLRPGLSDENHLLRFKEVIKVLLGRSRSFIPMAWFSKGYSYCAAEIPFLPKKCELINLSPLLRENMLNRAEEVNNNSSAIILSQWFVANGVLTEDEMIAFYSKFVISHLSKYKIIYYKPHPWDSAEFTARVKACFGFSTVIDEDLPVELWLSGNPSADLFGFWTSTMFYCNGVLPNKSYSMLSALADFTKNENVRHQCEVVHDLILSSGAEVLKFHA